MKQDLHLAHQKTIHSFEAALSRMPVWAIEQHVGEWIRLLRKQLGMTQAQLAKRSGVPQAKIARIETGKTDFRMSTLKRLLAAMDSNALVLPHPHQSLEAIRRTRARGVAERNVARVLGTSALEKQEPAAPMRKAMILAEEKRLLEERSSELWEDL
jgi:transcriptional regulator with XRE-family HTH domain